MNLIYKIRKKICILVEEKNKINYTVEIKSIDDKITFFFD